MVLPAPAKRELVAAPVSVPGDPWWEVPVFHAKLYPGRKHPGIVTAVLSARDLALRCAVEGVRDGFDDGSAGSGGEFGAYV
ncbi:hypothetical protein [Kitasatospora xanthocidica]|uniref:hypothetical protein n=1 Tax=Kitasatospora xanthocidica TaxID=83382 RepID=UPI00167310A0|nr:hypothetical protein [Kitasatospora xanthocidica]